MGETIKTKQINEAFAFFAENWQPFLDAVEDAMSKLTAWMHEVIASNPDLAAYLRQDQQPRGLAHPAGRRGRARRWER